MYKEGEGLTALSSSGWQWMFEDFSEDLEAPGCNSWLGKIQWKLSGLQSTYNSKHEDKLTSLAWCWLLWYMHASQSRQRSVCSQGAACLFAVLERTVSFSKPFPCWGLHQHSNQTFFFFFFSLLIGSLGSEVLLDVCPRPPSSRCST